MAETIDIVYIGTKPVKKDTITGSRLQFPRMTPIPVPADIVPMLLDHPTVWRKAADMATVKQEQEAAAKQAAEEAARLEAEEAARREAENFLIEGIGDLGKMTSPQLATLCEAHELGIKKEAQESVPDFKVRVRDAIKAKLAQAGA
ncbi:hypothetical protein [Pseudaeromonas paramecii]|uniref:Uncharacterized protein n=1 Tax=Pseudaeromonas paramecii TaxID=2138166 RepID=A0ABP8PYL0_9GAMM